MTLTIGNAPFGPSPGTFNFERQGPAHVLYFEDSPRRVRVVLAGEVVADTRRAKLLHETGLLPVYYFPESDVRTDLLEASSHRSHCPFKGDAAYWTVRAGGRVAQDAVWSYPAPIEGAPPLAGYLAFYWDRMDAWYEEDEEVFVHPRDPYHRVDVLPSSRHVQISVDGEPIAESARPMLLFETGLPPRYYLPADDVRMDLLVPSDTQSRCPYKGTASYWSLKTADDQIEDLVWAYPEPLAVTARIAGLLCFFQERIDLEVDGELQERPVTRWS
jgi:uncharacterized protein (DUF427 family)